MICLIVWHVLVWLLPYDWIICVIDDMMWLVNLKTCEGDLALFRWLTSIVERWCKCFLVARLSNALLKRFVSIGGVMLLVVPSFTLIKLKTHGLSISDRSSHIWLMNVVQWRIGLFVFSHRSVHSGVILAINCLPCVWAWWVVVSWVISGMSTVKVHEWCLVCYGWLALCLRNNFHLAYLFSLVSMLVSHWTHSGFPVLHA